MMLTKKPAGIRAKGAAWMLAAFALLFGMAVTGCGEDPASADDIARAAVREAAAEEAKKKAAEAETVQSEFYKKLQNDRAQTVTATVPVTGGGETNAVYTVTSAGSSAYLPASFSVSKDNGSDSYTILWSKTSVTPDTATLTMSGDVKLTSATTAKAEAALTFLIRNNATRTSVASGTVTLTHQPTSTVFLDKLESTFEMEINSLRSTEGDFQFDNDGPKAVTRLNGSWTQNDASFSVNMRKPTDAYSSTNLSVNLPASADWTLDDTALTGKASGFKVSADKKKLEAVVTTAGNDNDGYTYSLSATTGTLTLKFELKNPTAGSTEKVTGKLVITVQDTL